jgi:hypothetical protein
MSETWKDMNKKAKAGTGIMAFGLAGVGYPTLSLVGEVTVAGSEITTSDNSAIIMLLGSGAILLAGQQLLIKGYKERLATEQTKNKSDNI